MSSSSSQTQPEADLASATQRHEQIRTKLRQLYYEDQTTFFLLVRSARVPRFVVKLCIFEPAQCALEHPDCSDTKPYLGLVISINEHRHAEIDPEIRDVILSSTSKDLIMPRLVNNS